MSAQDALTNALRRLSDDIEQARQRGEPEPRAGALATVDAQGKPGVRTIHVLDVDDTALYFSSALTSRKVADMRANPHVSLCLIWHSLTKQTTLDGVVQPCDDATSDRLWRRRPVADQRAIRAILDQPDAGVRAAREHASDAARGGSVNLPRPQAWGGFRLSPTQIVEWPTGWYRIQARTRTLLNPAGEWIVSVPGVDRPD